MLSFEFREDERSFIFLEKHDRSWIFQDDFAVDDGDFFDFEPTRKKFLQISEEIDMVLIYSPSIQEYLYFPFELTK